jgi:hypothetical protein
MKTGGGRPLHKLTNTNNKRITVGPLRCDKHVAAMFIFSLTQVLVYTFILPSADPLRAPLLPLEKGGDH